MIDAVLMNGMMIWLLTISIFQAHVCRMRLHIDHTTFRKQMNTWLSMKEQTRWNVKSNSLRIPNERKFRSLSGNLCAVCYAFQFETYIPYALLSAYRMILNAYINPATNINITHLCHAVWKYLFMTANIRKNQTMRNINFSTYSHST